MALPLRSAAIALLPLLAVSCQRPPTPQSQAARSVITNCRTQVDRQYTAQNRADLSRVDQRDEPFAGQYVSGIVTAGLSQQYGRDKAVDSCVRANGGPSQVADPGEGPTFNPGLSRPP